MTAKEKLNYLAGLFDCATDDWLSQEERIKKCVKVFILEQKKLCSYVSKEDYKSVEQFRSIDELFVSYWDNLLEELEKL
jgi:hypothetical protein